MIQEIEFVQIEQETSQIFRQAGWSRTTNVFVNQERIENIIGKAQFQNVIKDSTSFIFLGFGAALSSLSSAAMGSPLMKDIDYKA